MDNITRGDFGEGGRRLAARKKKKRTLLILLCIILVTVAVFLSPVFCIGSIDITGTRELSDDYIISNARLEKGMHITRVNFSESEKALAKTPYVSSADIKYRFPNTLEIIIEERFPVVYYQFADGYVGINSKGIVTDIIQTMERRLPVASGITLTSYSIGEKPELTGTQDAQIDVLTEVAGKLYHAGLSETVSAINVKEITNIILTTHMGQTVKCGDTSELDYKFSVLKSVFEQSDDSGTIDISNPGQAIHTID